MEHRMGTSNSGDGHTGPPRSLQLVILLLLLLLLGGCGGAASFLEAPEPHILFWHDWSGSDATLLNQLLNNFAQLRPDLDVVDTELAASTLESEFVVRFGEGLEPDLLLTNAATAQELIAAGYVKEISSYGVDVGGFSPAALSTVQSGTKLYGVPFAVSTQLLFYNRDEVPAPPRTMEELEVLTSSPQIVMGLNTSFYSAYWGLRAFGGRTYDPEGNFVLDPGALVNWLTTLTNIQGAAGFLLSNNQEQLRNQFLAGETDLYVADASEVGLLAEAFGDRLGISILPDGDGSNPAGPLLHVSVLLISANAGEQQTAEAIELIRFLTNTQQQSLMTVNNIGRLAARDSVYISPSMPPVVVQLATQIGSAVPVTLDQRSVWDKVAARGQTLYRSVLEGAVDEQAAVLQLAQYVDEVQGHPASQHDLADVDCPALSTQVRSDAPFNLEIWHAWSPDEGAVLAELAHQYQTLCPGVTITLSSSNNSTLLYNRYRSAAEGGGGPHVLLGSTEWLALLAEEGLIRPLTSDMRPGELTAFVPSAVKGVTLNGSIYAYPESVHSLALFYNPTLVASPPKSLRELQLQVDLDHRFSMPLSLFYSYWGLHAFGGEIYDAEGNIAFNQGALDWLDWLQSAAHQPGFVFTTGRGEAEQLFATGEAAYMVGGPWSLPRLRAALPPDELAVTILPSGPVDQAAPVLEVEGFMINSSAGVDATAAAMAFARFVTSTQSAQLLLQTGDHVPANVIINIAQDPLIDAFIDQAQLAEPVVQDEAWQEADLLSRPFLREVVLGGSVSAANLETAASDFADALNEARP
jgi:arabinogalactan oligomer/maltooligosaccharide transport system substrate-binding protein